MHFGKLVCHTHRRGAVSAGAVLRKSLGFSHRRTSDHLQPPSVHGLRVHAVSYVARAARYITVQVRSQNSNPRSQEVVRSTRRERLTFARIALLAGGRVRDDADDGADCGRAQRVAGVCTSSCWATSRLLHHSSSPAVAWVLSRSTQLPCPSRSRRGNPSRTASSRG